MLCATGTGGDAIGSGERLSAMSGYISAIMEEVDICLPLDSESACLGSVVVTVRMVPEDPGASYVFNRGVVGLEGRE